MNNFLPEKVLEILAFDLGIIFLMVWFLILLLVLREFRKFASQVAGQNKVDDASLKMCQAAIDDALSQINNNEHVLNELIQLQRALESQVTNIKESTQDHVSDEEQMLINDLNNKLNRSHQLIKKLKGDLDTSCKKLGVTRQKLYQQYDSVDQLKKEKGELEQRYQDLEKEYSSTIQAGNPKQMEKEHQVEKQNLLATINAFKKQLETQDKEIMNMMNASAAGGASGPELKAAQKDLAAAQVKLKQMEKEKDFVESRFLELLDKVENKKG